MNDSKRFELETVEGDPLLVGDRMAPDEPEAMLPRGASLGRYLVLGPLGGGGMGVVYAAYDPELDRKVAIKLVRPSPASGSVGDARQRLVREAQAMARVVHPNVVTVHDVGTVDDRVFVAMEYIDGQSLRSWLAAMPPPRSVRTTLGLLMEAGKGLAAAHEQQLVHRDFKPDNVMIDKRGRVVVMDFGLARAATRTGGAADSTARGSLDLEADVTLTQAGSIVGTPAYMAPEQCNGLSAGAAADQFSFCVTAYEALYGERPFGGHTLAEAMAAIASGDLLPEPRGSDVPRWVRRVLVRGLATQAEQRWPSMDALLASLRSDPALRRRPWVLGGGALLVGAAVTTSVLARNERMLAACDVAGHELQSLWNAQTHTRVVEALTWADGAPDPDSGARVVDMLDTWTSRWARDRSEVCRQDGIDRTLAADDVQRALSCFSEQRQRLEAFVDVYAGAPVSGASAVGAAAALSRLPSCADTAALASGEPPPSDPLTRDGIAGVRLALARAAALTGAAELDAARSVAEGAATEASAIGSGQLLAEARLVLATVAEEQGDYEHAATELDEAFSLASQARAELLSARVAIRLLRVLGYDLGRTGEALVWGRMAETLLARVGAEEGPEAAQLASDRGLSLQAQGDLEAATAAHERALALRRAVLGDAHPDLGHSYGNLGNIALLQRRYAEAEQWHRRALAVRSAALGAEHPVTALSNSNLGRVALAAGDTADALSQLQRARAILERALGGSHRATARTLKALGDVWLAQGEIGGALALYNDAFRIQEQQLGREHLETAESAHAAAEALVLRGEPEPALRYFRLARIARHNALGADHADTAASRNAIFLLCDGGHAPACDGP